MGGAVKAVEKTVEKVEQVGQNIINNPLPLIETTLLVSAGVPAPAASAVVTYANGGSVEDAAKAGAVSFAGQEAGEAYAPTSQAPDRIDVGGGFNPATGAGDPTTAAAAAAGQVPVEKAGVRGAASGATRAALKGGSAKDIVTGGVVGGLAGAGGEAVTEAAGFEPGSIESALTKSVVGGTIQDIFTPTRSAQTVGGGGYVPTSVTTTGAGQAPGSQALAQALRIGDAGEPIFGGDKEDKGKQSGWNVESLRYMGQES